MRSVAHLLLVAACLAACAQRPRMEPPPATPSRPASARDPPRVSAVSDPVDCSPPWESPRPPTRSGPHLEAQPELPPPERRPTPPLEQWDSTNRTFLEAMKAVCDVIYADVTVGGHTL